MTEQRIDHANGTTTIVCDSFTLGGLEVGGVPSRPERQQPVVWLTRGEIEKRHPFLAGDGLEQVSSMVPFPRPALRPRPGTWCTSPVWREHEVERWICEVRERIALMQQLVGR